ncbi:DNA cytosine methyltransferase [Lelliottia nimipressuralis]|uniref:DNA cytosine methyltransferase n=1 Tax=Lelliottia nimipressuralis TaxID=69220 RepID=UPI003905DE1F
MLKNGQLTYITLFSSAGVGCYGFKMEGFKCVATNELLTKRMDIQKNNNICEYESGYIIGDLATDNVKNKIYEEVNLWAKKGNDRVDVLFATPPCQGISVINHKKNEQDINRNSLVVESIDVVKKIKPRIFIFENVMAFQKTLCILPDERIIPIGDYIKEALGEDYIITGTVKNLMNYGSNSSRTRSVVIGVDKSFKNNLTPLDIFPDYEKEKTLRDVIYNYPALSWGEINEQDFYHGFRTYDTRMLPWISDLKEGQSAFDNQDPKKRPHRIINGRVVENVKKNRDKYTRQRWDRFIHCVHTRNDQLAAQNTIHPEQDRVYSIRELMAMMSIPKSFKWINQNLSDLNKLSEHEKKSIYKSYELTIRACIGEAVPTAFIGKIAKKIKSYFDKIYPSPTEINKIISNYNLESRVKLKDFISNNPLDLNISSLMRITELCNAKREENAAFYTNKFIVNEIVSSLPNFNKDTVRIIEPSVGAGSFIPFIFKKYDDVKNVVLDLVDIDADSIETLKLLLKKIKTPNNFKVNIIHEDFLTMKIEEKYDLAIGNPPFSKVNGKSSKREHYINQAINKETLNLSAMFLEKCMDNSECVSLVLNKTILSNYEFRATREILRKVEIRNVIDFGRYGFTGVSIETMNLIVFPKNKPNATLIYNMKHNRQILQSQEYITDSKFPSFIIYRDASFDLVANKIKFDCFNVFRDRQITKKLTSEYSGKNSLWVLKAKNITDNNNVQHIKDYDQYIDRKSAQELNVYKFLNDTSVYLTPNMTYNPRIVRNLPNTLADGSTAILIPKTPLELTEKQIAYFSSDEYRKFYSIARNLSTQSINVDKSSVFFYGILKNDTKLDS